jgi:thioredoxin reductase
VNAEDIVVIGAGPAGLAASASLRRCGLFHLVLERSDDIASSWRRHYDRLHLHTVKRHSGLPYTPWPRDTPRYPSRDDVVRYLERDAGEHRIKPRFGVEVHRVARASDRFVVETSAGRLNPRFVIVASGYNGVPNRPEFPGLAGFAGTVSHSQAYRNPQPYVGRRVLVVGCGNSGAEIALDLADHGVDVAMVVRGPVHVVPRDIWGRPSQETTVMLSRLPARARDLIVSPILRLAVGDLSRWGIVRPRRGPTQLIEETGRIPMLDVGTIAQVKAGRIRVRPGIDEVMSGGVRFEDGRTESFEAIVLATGYRPGLDRIIAGFKSISDERGRPDRFGTETGIPGLFFVGFRNPATGALREIGLEAPRTAAAIRDR